jgi:ribosomal protein L12E/L44/L45/RPP1/RPP2
MAKDNKLTKDEIEAILKQAQTDKEEKNKAEAFLDSLEDAPIATIIKAVKQKGLFVRVKAGFADDRWEAKELKKKAYNITNSVRGAGGFSY